MNARTASGAARFELDGRVVEVTNPDRVLWPRAGFTKRDLADYYVRVAPALLPHLRGRPLTFKRAPYGLEGKWWFQTECPHPPEWVACAPVPAADGERVWRYCIADDGATLVWLANLGAIELHPLLSTADDLDRPRSVVFDLDPGDGVGLVEAARVALGVRDELHAVGFEPLAKTSGGTGIHVAAALDRHVTFDDTRALARSIAARLTERDPHLVTDRMIKSERTGKVFVDWQQNGRFKSLVAPYSLRLLGLPFVSMPVSWDEVEDLVAANDPTRLLFLPDDALDRVLQGNTKPSQAIR